MPLTKTVLALAVLPLVVPAPSGAPPTPPPTAHAPAPLPWGQAGHRMAARQALSALPAEVPAFFRDAADQLVYLNPEPDRWRSFALREMDQAFSYDHYVDLENVPDGALDASDRYTYLKALYDAGLPKPERDAGFLPFHIVELYQRLVTEWRLWRAETDAETRRWIAERIVNDAGTLGHYVTDASQPHHTTIHFNGWNTSDAHGNAWPNPEGYTRDDTFHGRFESAFVEAHVTPADVARFANGGRAAPGDARPRSVAGEARAAVMDHIRASHARVEALYRLDRDVGFDPGAPLDEATRDFAAERLAAGADMLTVLWWSAWLESGG